MSFKEITPEQAWEMVQNGAMLVDFDSPIIVSCYHGVSSRNVANFLVEQGYENVFSVIGGFDGWVKAGLPIETAY